jgi:hypothetical protein
LSTTAPFDSPNPCEGLKRLSARNFARKISTFPERKPQLQKHRTFFPSEALRARV